MSFDFDEHVRALIREEFARLRAAERPVDDYIKLADAAKIAGTTRRTVGRWIAAGKLPSYGTGRVVRVRRAELEALMRGGAGAVDSADAIAEAIFRRDFR